MLRKIIWAVMAMGLITSVWAAEPPSRDDQNRRAAAEQLLDLFNMDQTYDQAMQQAMNMAVSMIDSQDIPEIEKTSARQAVEASMKISMEKFAWKRMKGIFVDIYANVLDLEELQGLIAFYKTPIGQRFLKKQPQLSLATMEKMQLLMKEMMPDLQKAVDKALEMQAVIEVRPEPASE